MRLEPREKLLRGRFWTGNGHEAREILVANGRILAIDPPHLPGSIDVEDLGRDLITPGFHDAHLHAFWVGDQLLRQADLTGSASIDEVLRRLRQHAPTRGPGEWLIGRGFDQEKVAERRFPTREELDAVGAGRPVLVLRICGHAGAVSSAIRPRGENVLTEFTLWSVFSKIPPLSEADLAAAATLALNVCQDNGLVAVGSMLEEARQLDVLLAMGEAGHLPIPVTANPPGASAEAFAARGIVTGHRRGNCRVGAAKFFADGSFGARTAFLAEDYSDAPGERGLELMSASEMTARFAQVHALGFQIAVHAIGDAALRNVLTALEPLCEGDNPRRHRIEHTTLCPPDCVERLARANIVAVVQPQFVESDSWLIQRLGDRIENAYVFRDMDAAGVRLALSSDAPVEVIRAEACLQAAVKGAAGRPQTCLSLDRALAAYTFGSAFADGVEDDFGTLELGKRASFSRVAADGTVSIVDLKPVPVTV